MKLRAAWLALCLVTSNCYSNDLEELLSAVWKVKVDKSIATGFLIDSRGYFITVAHAFPTTDMDKLSKLEVTLSSNDGVHDKEAKVIHNWCTDLDKNLLCNIGFDMALLKVKDWSHEFGKPLDIGFEASNPKVFKGTFIGYSNLAVSAGINYDAHFSYIKAIKHPKKAKLFTNSTYFYETSETSYKGNSGGPIVVKVNDKKYNAVGLMTWRIPQDFDSDAKSGPSYASPIEILQKVSQKLPLDSHSVAVANSVIESTISINSAVEKLDGLSNLQLHQLIDYIDNEGNFSNLTDGFVVALFDQTIQRKMDYDQIRLENHVRLSSNISWHREIAKAKIRIGESLLRTDTEKAKDYFLDAKNQYNQFVAASVKSNPSWLGDKVYYESVRNLINLNKITGDLSAAKYWGALGAEAGDHLSTNELGNLSYKSKDYETAYKLFSLSKTQAQEKNLTVPSYVEKSISESLKGVKLKDRVKANELVAAPEKENIDGAHQFIEQIPIPQDFRDSMAIPRM